MRDIGARARADAEFEAGKPAMIKRWQDDVEALAQQVSAWLDEFTTTGSMAITPGWSDIDEEVLGTYSARRLTITAGGKCIEFVPVGRIMIGSHGTVLMHTPPTSRPDNTVAFHRMENDGTASWNIVTPMARRETRDGTVLTRENFEAALDALLLRG